MFEVPLWDYVSDRSLDEAPTPLPLWVCLDDGVELSPEGQTIAYEVDTCEGGSVRNSPDDLGRLEVGSVIAVSEPLKLLVEFSGPDGLDWDLTNCECGGSYPQISGGILNLDPGSYRLRFTFDPGFVGEISMTTSPLQSSP